MFTLKKQRHLLDEQIVHHLKYIIFSLSLAFFAKLLSLKLNELTNPSSTGFFQN